MKKYNILRENNLLVKLGIVGSTLMTLIFILIGFISDEKPHLFIYSLFFFSISTIAFILYDFLKYEVPYRNSGLLYLEDIEMKIYNLLEVKSFEKREFLAKRLLKSFEKEALDDGYYRFDKEKSIEIHNKLLGITLAYKK